MPDSSSQRKKESRTGAPSRRYMLRVMEAKTSCRRWLIFLVVRCSKIFSFQARGVDLYMEEYNYRLR